MAVVGSREEHCSLGGLSAWALECDCGETAVQGESEWKLVEDKLRCTLLDE